MTEGPLCAKYVTQLEVSTTRALTRDPKINVKLEPTTKTRGLGQCRPPFDQAQSLFEGFSHAGSGHVTGFFQQIGRQIGRHSANLTFLSHTGIHIIVHIV